MRTNPVEVRACTPTDLRAVERLQHAWEAEGITRGFVAVGVADLRGRLGPYFLVAELDGRIVGFACGSEGRSEGNAVMAPDERYVEVDELSDVQMNDPRLNMPSPLLQIGHLTRSYPKVVALNDVSLALAVGEIHAVLGEEYAGKTTLLRILGGLEKPGTYDGEVLLEGQPLALKNPRQAIDLGIAIVPRRLQLFDHLTLAENICVGHLPGKGLMIDSAAIARQARQALDLLELRLDPAARPPQLSSTQQRMVMIARAVSLRPRLVVMDEPATSLNSAEALGGLIRAIRVLSAHEIGVLYLTRRSSEVLQMGDRVSVLRDGAIAGTFERAAFDERMLKDLMASQQYRDFGHADDDEEPRGLDRWLRTVFSGWR